jgi:hypothetical protein
MLRLILRNLIIWLYILRNLFHLEYLWYLCYRVCLLLLLLYNLHRYMCLLLLYNLHRYNCLIILLCCYRKLFFLRHTSLFVNLSYSVFNFQITWFSYNTLYLVIFGFWLLLVLYYLVKLLLKFLWLWLLKHLIQLFVKLLGFISLFIILHLIITIFCFLFLFF